MKKLRKNIKDRPGLLKDVVEIMCSKKKGLTEEDAYDLYKCIVNWIKEQAKNGDSTMIDIPTLGCMYKKLYEQKEEVIYNNKVEYKPNMVRFQRMFEEDLEERNSARKTNYKFASPTYVASIENNYNKDIYDIEKFQNSI